MQSPSNPADVATLLNYGRDPEQVDQEIKMDLLCGLTQRRRSMFYLRGYGCQPLENSPSGVQFFIATRHAIASWIAQRNLETGDGSGSTVDRRAVTSQDLITISANGENVDVTVLVIPTHDVSSRIPVQVPMGGR